MLPLLCMGRIRVTKEEVKQAQRARSPRIWIPRKSFAFLILMKNAFQLQLWVLGNKQSVGRHHLRHHRPTLSNFVHSCWTNGFKRCIQYLQLRICQYLKHQVIYIQRINSIHNNRAISALMAFNSSQLYLTCKSTCILHISLFHICSLHIYNWQSAISTQSIFPNICSPVIVPEHQLHISLKTN